MASNAPLILAAAAAFLLLRKKGNGRPGNDLKVSDDCKSFDEGSGWYENTLVPALTQGSAELSEEAPSYTPDLFTLFGVGTGMMGWSRIRQQPEIESIWLDDPASNPPVVACFMESPMFAIDARFNGLKTEQDRTAFNDELQVWAQENIEAYNWLVRLHQRLAADGRFPESEFEFAYATVAN
jgi:hypothetical protein